MDRPVLLAAPRHGAGGPVEHLTHALTADSHALGDPAQVLSQITAGPGGPAAVSWLLQVMAWRLHPEWGGIATGRLHFTRAVARPATEPELAAVTTVWRAALTANLPPGALAGAGHRLAAPGPGQRRAHPPHTPGATERGEAVVTVAVCLPSRPSARLVHAFGRR